VSNFGNVASNTNHTTAGIAGRGGGSIPRRDRLFYFTSQRPDRPLRLQQVFCQIGNCVALPLGIMLMEQEADHSPPSNAHFWNVEPLYPLPHTSLQTGTDLIKSRENFSSRQKLELQKFHKPILTCYIESMNKSD
jgi:hypothetical protein